MRRRALHGRGISGSELSFDDTVPKGSQVTLQRFNGFPLRRDGGIQIFNRLILMGYTNFEFIKA